MTWLKLRVMFWRFLCQRRKAGGILAAQTRKARGALKAAAEAQMQEAK